MYRDKRYILGAGLLAMILTLALLVRLADTDRLLPFAKSSPPAAVEGSGAFSSARDGLEAILGGQTPAEEDGFTLVVPSWRRLDTLPDFIRHYASGDIPSLRRILLIWPTPQGDAPAGLLSNVTGYPVPVIVDQRPVNTLNGRFLRTDDITTNCVLAIDDDMLYDPKDIEFAYNVWKDFGGRTRMAGTIPRGTDEQNTAYYFKTAKLKKYSMILTKTAFFHVDWMDVYWSSDERMTRLRAYVDEHFNCEDILMSFLHAHHTRKSPLYVKPGSAEDTGMKGGVSDHKNHIKHRANCIARFAKEFGQDTLIPSNTVFSRL